MIVVADTSPAELQDTGTPGPVRKWMDSIPAWFEVRTVSHPPDTSVSFLDRGEREAITLAGEVKAGRLN